MTIIAFILRIVRRVGFLQEYSKKVLKKKLKIARARKKLNHWYNKRNYDEQSIIQNLYCKLFRSSDVTPGDEEWIVKFRSREFRMPLRDGKWWLDWDNALSILGHDPDVKLTYENLLDSGKIKTFLDVGGNYGTHSLLFLSQGVHTITFEPNIYLKNEFDLYCSLNGLSGKMEPVAVSKEAGNIDFFFPENETWLGTTVNERVDFLKKSFDFKKVVVPSITLDGYCDSNHLAPDLIKIDTEGNELDVLKGASHILKQIKPLIIFESIEKVSRESLWEYFKENRYFISKLPYNLGNKEMDKDEFNESGEFNFIAVPAA